MSPDSPLALGGRTCTVPACGGIPVSLGGGGGGYYIGIHRVGWCIIRDN